MSMLPRKKFAIGAIIKPEMIDIQSWPKHLKLEDMVEANPNQANAN